MAARFNPPPGWPPAPEGWTPPPGWAPDPSWPPPPQGWQLWVDDAATTHGSAAPVAPAAPGAPDVSRFASPDAAATQQLPPQPDAPSFDKHVTAPDAAPPASAGPAAFGGLPGYAGSAPAPAGFGAAPGGQPQSGGWHGGPAGPDGFPPAGQPNRGKQWLIPVIIAVVALLAIFGVLMATGVIGGDDKAASSQSEKSSKPTTTEKASDEPSEKPSEKPSTEASDNAVDVPSTTDTGTRDAPLAIGVTAPVHEWTVSMGAANLDAWGEISTVAPEGAAPADGFVFVMAPSTVVYNGEDRLSLFDLNWVFVSGAGRTFDDTCSYAYLPDELDRLQELYTGATATGNVCVTVPREEVAGGVWRVSSYGDYSGTFEAYFALS